MEAVAAHARVVELLRQREHLRERRVGAVERGVEAGDLRQLRRALQQRADRREVVRLVQRRERHELLELRHDRGVDADRRGVVGAAVDDAMADRGEPVVRAVRRLQPVEDVRERAVVAELRARLPALLAGGLAGGVLRDEARRGVDALDLPAGDERELARRARRTART